LKTNRTNHNALVTFVRILNNIKIKCIIGGLNHPFHSYLFCIEQDSLLYPYLISIYPEINAPTLLSKLAACILYRIHIW
jgi:hypothetical protein